MSNQTKTVKAPVKPPPFVIKNREARQEERFIKMLVYGDYGVGKTYLAGTAADVEGMGDVFMVSAEAGDLTLDSVDTHNFADIDSARVSNFLQAVQTYDYLKLHCQYRDAKDMDGLRSLQARMTLTDEEDIADEDIKQYRTVIIDSLTEVEIYCMNQLLGINDETGLQEESQSAEWSEYKKQFHMMQRLVRAFRELPMHVIMTAARQYTQDDQKKMLFAPQLTGKLAGQVQGFMDIVGYLTIGTAGDDGNIPRRMYVQPVGRYAAKNRFSNYKPPHFDNPTMLSIMKNVGIIKKDK